MIGDNQGPLGQSNGLRQYRYRQWCYLYHLHKEWAECLTCPKENSQTQKSHQWLKTRSMVMVLQNKYLSIPCQFGPVLSWPWLLSPHQQCADRSVYWKYLQIMPGGYNQCIHWSQIETLSRILNHEPPPKKPTLQHRYLVWTLGQHSWSDSVHHSIFYMSQYLVYLWYLITHEFQYWARLGCGSG